MSDLIKRLKEIVRAKRFTTDAETCADAITRIRELEAEVARLTTMVMDLRETESGDLYHERQLRQAAEAKLLAIETLLPEWERKPMSDWESVYVGPQHGRNECARKIRSILKEQSSELAALLK